MNKTEDSLLKVQISPDYLTAEIYCTKQYEENKELLNRYELDKILEKYNVSYGIDEEAVELILSRPPATSFPITIAKGTPPQRGEDGQIVYKFNTTSKVEKEEWDFRDVMEIPSVTTGDLLAKIIPPTKGIDGRGVNNLIIQAKPGKPYPIRQGRNVDYNEDEKTFYATEDGQVVVRNNKIEVQPVYEVHGDLTLEVGNIDFIGSVIIHGDVPTGFKVKAGGDVKIYGIVEAATIISGGSIYIYEGFAGLQKGLLQAEEDIHVGYMNQGNAQAKQSIFVQNSILHSVCSAGKDIYCKSGNIIGGRITAGRTVEAVDIGNRLNIKTTIELKINEKLLEKEQQLLTKKAELEKNITNLNLIKEKLLSQQNVTDQIKQLLIKHKNSFTKTQEELEIVKEQLKEIEETPITNSKLILYRTLYPNTVVSFGKYQRMIDRQYDRVEVVFDEKDIKIIPSHR